MTQVLKPNTLPPLLAKAAEARTHKWGMLLEFRNFSASKRACRNATPPRPPRDQPGDTRNGLPTLSAKRPMSWASRESENTKPRTTNSLLKAGTRSHPLRADVRSKPISGSPSVQICSKSVPQISGPESGPENWTLQHKSLLVTQFGGPNSGPEIGVTNWIKKRTNRRKFLETATFPQSLSLTAQGLLLSANGCCGRTIPAKISLLKLHSALLQTKLPSWLDRARFDTGSFAAHEPATSECFSAAACKLEAAGKPIVAEESAFSLKQNDCRHNHGLLRCERERERVKLQNTQNGKPGHRNCRCPHSCRQAGTTFRASFLDLKMNRRH